MLPVFRLRVFRIDTILGLLVAVGLPSLVVAQSEIEKAATAGRNKIVVAGAAAAQPSRQPEIKPDLLFFKDGRIAEVRNLKLVNDHLEYEVIGADGKLYTKGRAKHSVVSVQFGRSLQDFLRDQEQSGRQSGPPIVAPAKVQPVRHEEILAGRFTARQGKYTRWAFTFTSQVNKYYPHARRATEYGTFVLRSHMLQPIDDHKTYENEVIAKGKYFLFAPGVFGNEHWVLNLSEVSYTENDIAPRQSIYTERLDDEVLILKLSKDRNVFNLEWANQEGWQWTSPTQQTFYRVRSSARGDAVGRASGRFAELRKFASREKK